MRLRSSAAVLGDSPRERLALVFDGTHQGEGCVSLTYGSVLGGGSDLRGEGLVPDVVRKLANRSPESRLGVHDAVHYDSPESILCIPREAAIGQRPHELGVYVA